MERKLIEMPILQYNKLNDQYTLTISKDTVKAKKWKKGQKIAVGFNERGNVELTGYNED